MFKSKNTNTKYVLVSKYAPLPSASDMLPIAAYYICPVVSEYTYYVYDTADAYCLCVIVSVCLYSGNFKQISLFVVVYSMCTVLVLWCPQNTRIMSMML